MMRNEHRRVSQTVALTLASTVAIAIAIPTQARAQGGARDLDRDVEALTRLSSHVARDLEDVIRQSAEVIASSIAHDVTRDALRGVEPLLRASSAAIAAEQDRDYRIERTDRVTRTLALGPNGLLELKNISGDIQVTVGSGRDVVIEVLRVSRGRTESDAARGLQEVQVAIDLRGERGSADITYPRGNTPYRVNATYTVTAPAGTRITARSISGDVSVKGIKGDVAAETVSGSVTVSDGRVSKAQSISGDIRIADVEGSTALNASSVSGSVSLQRVQARRVAVDAVSGDIHAEDITCDSAQLKSLSGSVDYSGRLAPSGRYELNSHSGPIRLTAVGPGGFELQASTFSGRIRPEGLSLQSMTMNRGSLRATVGDGSAVVVAQTFSGDVVIAKR